MLSDAIIDRNVHLSALVLSTEMPEAEGSGGRTPPQILADRLTLSQPGGADYAHQIILTPPDFQTFLRPCMIFTFDCYDLFLSAFFDTILKRLEIDQIQPKQPLVTLKSK